MSMVAAHRPREHGLSCSAVWTTTCDECSSAQLLPIDPGDLGDRGAALADLLQAVVAQARHALAAPRRRGSPRPGWRSSASVWISGVILITS